MEGQACQAQRQGLHRLQFLLSLPLYVLIYLLLSHLYERAAELTRDVTAERTVLAYSLGAVTLTVTRLGGLESEPGGLAVIGIALSGLAFSATVFHVIRHRVARGSDLRALPGSLVEAHVAALRDARRSERAR